MGDFRYSVDDDYDEESIMLRIDEWKRVKEPHAKVKAFTGRTFFAARGPEILFGWM